MVATLPGMAYELNLPLVNSSEHSVKKEFLRRKAAPSKGLAGAASCVKLCHGETIEC